MNISSQRFSIHIPSNYQKTTALRGALILGLIGLPVHANAQDLKQLEFMTLSQLTAETPLKLNSIELLSLEDIAAGTPVALDSIAPEDSFDGIEGLKSSDVTGTPLAIEKVRLLALENNLNLKAQVLRPGLVDAQLDEARDKFGMIFTGNFGFNGADIIPTGPSDPNDPVISTDGYSADFGLQIPFSTGTLVTVNLPTDFNEPDIEGVDGIANTSLAFSISQPLLRNAGKSANNASIRIAELRSKQELARTKLAAIQTLSQAENAYWNLYATANTLSIRHQQYERAVELERKATRLADARVIPRIEVIRAQSGVARKLEGIIVANTSRKQAERALKVILNDDTLPVTGSELIKAETDPDPVYFNLEPATVAELAVENRLDLIDLQLQLSVEDQAILFAENQKKPQFDLNANTRFSGQGDSLGDSFGSDFTSWQIGANFSVPIGNRAAKARLSQSKIQKDISQTNLRIQQRIIHQQVFDSLDLLDQSWQRILAARQESLLAGKTYDAEERQFLAGVRTSTDVLEAADFLAEAQIREIQALAAYESDKINAALATGTLLGKGQVELDFQK